MPANIKDNLLRMKQLSEHMVDLAYDAVFSQDRLLCNQVRKMYDELEQLEELTLKLLFKIKDSDEHRMYLIDIMDLMKEIADGARHIAQLVESRKAPDIVREVFSKPE